MTGLILSLTKINKVEHIGRETEAIAELLKEHADIDNQQTFGQRIAHIYIDEIGNGDGKDHRPQPFLQTVFSCRYAAENAAECKSDDTHRTLNKSVFLRRKA